MPYPSIHDLDKALLAFIANHDGGVRPIATYEPLALLFGLSDEEKLRTRGEEYGGDHPQRVWHNKVQYGRLRLKAKGYLDAMAPYGVWRLSEKGLREAMDLVPWSTLNSKRDGPSFMTSKLPEFVTYSTEESVDVDFVEGATREVKVNAYERNTKARIACLDHYGFDCAVCGFNFVNFYGEIGSGFIHVHHLKDLARVGGEYKVDPIKDLRPVCPNCHAMLHVDTPAMSISKLKSIISAQADRH